MSDIDQVILELKFLGEFAEVNGMTVEGNALHPIINMGWQALEHLRAEVASLKEENENLCTVMIAAAEEIHEFWDAHCDEEGYGPANLMHRLERGIPAEYGYKAGDFDRLTKERDTLTQQLATAKEYAERLREAGQAVVDRWHSPNWKDGTHTADYINRLRDAIRKSEG